MIMMLVVVVILMTWWWWFWWRVGCDVGSGGEGWMMYMVLNVYLEVYVRGKRIFYLLFHKYFRWAFDGLCYSEKMPFSSLFQIK